MRTVLMMDDPCGFYRCDHLEPELLIAIKEQVFVLRPPLGTFAILDGPCWREGMSELYDEIKGDVRFRKKVAEKAGLGFERPNEFSSKIRVIGPNGSKFEKSRLEKVPASA